jgi:hypothetical protein
VTPDPASVANLRDLALPPPVAWWPPPLGWWVLAAGLLAVILLLNVWLALRYHRDAYRREAVRDLQSLTGAPPSAIAPAVASVLKRTALAAYPRTAAAGLTGEPWWTFLDQTGGFPAMAAAAMRRAALDPSHALDPAEARTVLAAAHRWIRGHRRGAAS